jgi:hypothetical protein
MSRGGLPGASGKPYNGRCRRNPLLSSHITRFPGSPGAGQPRIYGRLTRRHRQDVHSPRFPARQYSSRTKAFVIKLEYTMTHLSDQDATPGGTTGPSMVIRPLFSESSSLPNEDGTGHHTVRKATDAQPQRKRLRSRHGECASSKSDLSPRLTPRPPGCLTCRARKVKCDERPGRCLNCEDMLLDCLWQPGCMQKGTFVM